MLRSFSGRGFKLPTRQSLGVLGIALVWIVCVPVQGIFPVLMKKHLSWLRTPPLNVLFWDGKIQNGTNNQASRTGYVGDCVPHLRRVSIFIFVSSCYHGFLKYARIFTTRTFAFRFHSRQNPQCCVNTALRRRQKVAALNKMSSNTKPLPTVCQADRLLKLITW